MAATCRSQKMLLCSGIVPFDLRTNARLVPMHCPPRHSPTSGKGRAGNYLNLVRPDRKTSRRVLSTNIFVIFCSQRTWLRTGSPRRGWDRKVADEVHRTDKLIFLKRTVPNAFLLRSAADKVDWKLLTRMLYQKTETT
jgi:hypothetical protein